MDMLEKQIETQILRWLNFQKDIYAFKINTVGIYDSRKGVYRTNRNPFVVNGCSDILGLIRSERENQGIFFAIEVKTPKTIKNISDNQKAFLSKVSEQKGYTLVTDRLDVVIPFIEQIRREINYSSLSQVKKLEPAVL